MVLLLGMMLAVGTPLAEGDARGVVDGWLAAQNAGDLAAYDKLYAARFTGIRRSGPRTVRFDRAGWMRDRARMFGKPMTVAKPDRTQSPPAKRVAQLEPQIEQLVLAARQLELGEDEVVDALRNAWETKDDRSVYRRTRTK